MAPLRRRYCRVAIHGNLRQSAQLLGISRTALYNKLNQWQVDVAELRR